MNNFVKYACVNSRTSDGPCKERGSFCEGETLGFFLASGKVDEVRRLHDLGMDLNCTNFQGQTGLHIAACRGDKLMVECLLGMNIHVNKVDCHGCRPLNVSLSVALQVISQTF